MINMLKEIFHEVKIRLLCAWCCLCNQSVMLNMSTYSDAVKAKKFRAVIANNELNFCTSYFETRIDKWFKFHRTYQKPAGELSWTLY
jgi:hypothetical protein